MVLHIYSQFARYEEIIIATYVLMNAASSKSAVRSRKIWTWFRENISLVIDFSTKENRSNQQNERSIAIETGKSLTFLEKWFSLFVYGVERLHLLHLTISLTTTWLHLRMVYWLQWMCSYQQTNRRRTSEQYSLYWDSERLLAQNKPTSPSSLSLFKWIFLFVVFFFLEFAYLHSVTEMVKWSLRTVHTFRSSTQVF